jgi:hypothetical protein
MRKELKEIILQSLIFENFNKNLLLLKHDISLENLNILLEKIDDGNSFQIKDDNIYNCMDFFCLTN